MPRIRCAYEDCVFWDDHYCTAAEVEINPDRGCLTYKPTSELLNEWAEDEDILDEDLLDDDLLDEDDFLGDDLWDDEV